MPSILSKTKKIVPVIIILALLVSESSPILAQTIVPPKRPSLTKPRTVRGSIIVQFKDNPQFQYESKQEITIPILGQKIETRKEGFASKKFSSVTKITKNAKIGQVKEVYANFPQAKNKDKLFSMKAQPELFDETLSKLKNDPNVILAQPNYLYETSYIPNDPYLSQTPVSHYQWNLARINAPLAWDITKGNTNVKVAVIDTGFALEDYNETLDGTSYTYRKSPELSSVNVSAKYRHSSNRTSALGFCDPLPTPIIDNHPNDRNGHGTHVTSTILQAMNNNNHATGVAPNVSLIAISPEALGEGGFCTDDLLAAMQFAKDNGAHVVNMSLGGSSFDNAENQKIQELISAGITVVAAAGNDGERTSSPPIIFPAGFPNVIAVGATRYDNKRAFYSQYGTPTNGHNVTLVAPGGQWLTDDYTAVLDQNNDKLPDAIVQQTVIEGQPNVFTQVDETINPSYGAKCVSGGRLMESCGLMMGTSMASPHVTAAVALIKSVNINLTPAQVQQILIQTANKTAIPGYNENEYGAGLIDLYAAVIAAGGNPSQTQKGWNKLKNVTVSASSCPTWSQKVLRWLPSRVNYLQNSILSTYPNFYKCN